MIDKPTLALKPAVLGLQRDKDEREVKSVNHGRPKVLTCKDVGYTDFTTNTVPLEPGRNCHRSAKQIDNEPHIQDTSSANLPIAISNSLIENGAGFSTQTFEVACIIVIHHEQMHGQEKHTINPCRCDRS